MASIDDVAPTAEEMAGGTSAGRTRGRAPLVRSHGLRIIIMKITRTRQDGRFPGLPLDDDDDDDDDVAMAE